MLLVSIAKPEHARIIAAAAHDHESDGKSFGSQTAWQRYRRDVCGVGETGVMGAHGATFFGLAARLDMLWRRQPNVIGGNGTGRDDDPVDAG